jgi:hypothetical protein
MRQRRGQRKDLHILNDVRDPKFGRIAHQAKPVLVFSFGELGRFRNEMIGDKGRARRNGNGGDECEQKEIRGNGPGPKGSPDPTSSSMPQGSHQQLPPKATVASP